MHEAPRKLKFCLLKKSDAFKKSRYQTPSGSNIDSTSNHLKIRPPWGSNQLAAPKCNKKWCAPAGVGFGAIFF